MSSIRRELRGLESNTSSCVSTSLPLSRLSSSSISLIVSSLVSRRYDFVGTSTGPSVHCVMCAARISSALIFPWLCCFSMMCACTVFDSHSLLENDGVGEEHARLCKGELFPRAEEVATTSSRVRLGLRDDPEDLEDLEEHEE